LAPFFLWTNFGALYTMKTAVGLFALIVVMAIVVLMWMPWKNFSISTTLQVIGTGIAVAAVGAIAYIATRTRVMFTGQATPAAYEYLKSLGHAKIYWAAPPFNKKYLDAHPEFQAQWNTLNVCEYNVPTYGSEMSRNVIELLQSKYIAQEMSAAGVPIPALVMDDFVLTKLPKLDAINARLNAPILGAFINAVRSASIATMTPDAWHAMIVACGVNPDYMNNLHIDKILGMFGVTAPVPADLREDVRWISKICDIYRTKGAISDVINMAYILMDIPIPKDAVEINAHLREFIHNVPHIHPDFDILVMDGEADDLYTTIIMRALCPHIKVVGQAPNSSIATRMMSSGLVTSTFVDTESKNIKAIAPLFNV
jgi:hypothetical protein